MRILPIEDLPRRASLYVSSVICLGALVAIYSLIAVAFRWEPGWLFLAALTAFGAFFLVRVPFLAGVQLPSSPPHNLQSLGFSICDVFVFTAILLYSPEVAVVIGLIDGTIASLQIVRRRRPYRFLFNLAQLSLTIFLVGHLLYQVEAQTPPLDPGAIGPLPLFLLNLAVCTLLYFLLNTLAIGTAIALSTGRPLRELWMDNFSFSSIASLAAATGAAGIFFSIEREFLFAAVITLPVLLLVYHSYRLTNQRIRSLFESEKLLQSALDSLNSYIAVIDISGEIIATNAAWQAFDSPNHPFGKNFGVGVNYLDASVAQLSPSGAEASRIAVGIQRVLSGGTPFVSEYSCSDANQNFWFVVRVNLLKAEGPTRAVVSHEDITERKRAEADLRESEERYRKFFEEDLTGDFTAGPGGQLAKCNPAFARILGFDSVEEAGQANLFDLFPTRAASREFLATLLQERRLEYFQLQLKSLQGQLVHVVANITVLSRSDGSIEEIQGYLFDDTTRKRLEEELRQALKMEAVGKLAGGIAHDFNNILTVITGYGEFLLKATEKDEKLHREASIIMEAAHRAAKLTAKLLAFSRRQMLRPEVLNLNLVVRETEALLQRVIGEDIQLMTRLDAGLGMIRVDPSQIEQVIMNLAVNARDAMPNGGRLSIETSSLEVEEGFSGEISAGRYSCLQVRDSGEGIPPEL